MHDESFFGNPRTWVGLAFILFFVFFGRMLWRALAKILDDHSAAVRAELDEASRLRREAEAALRDAEQRRDAALAEAKALIESAQAQAERIAAATAAEAEAAAGRRAPNAGRGPDAPGRCRADRSRDWSIAERAARCLRATPSP